MKEILDLWYNFCLCTFILIFKKQNIILQNFKRKHISILCDLDIQRQIKRFVIVSSLVKRFMKTVFWNLSKPQTERQKRSPHMHMDEVDGECIAAGGMLTESLKAGWPTTDQCLKVGKKAFKTSGSIRSKNTPSSTRGNAEISEEQKHLWH